MGRFSESSIASGGSDSKRDINEDRVFRWESLRSFMYLSGTFASTNINFDIFSGNLGNVPLFMFVFLEFLIGMPFMCMEFFIKMYTGKIDFNEALNPILKGVNYVIIIQTTFWSVVHANDLADSVLYLFSSIYASPPYSECNKNLLSVSDKCISVTNISILCQDSSTKAILEQTSIHIYYKRVFIDSDKSHLTTRLLVIAMVWILNFFFSTISDTMVLRLFKLFFIFRSSTTILISIFVCYSNQEIVIAALKNLMSSTEVDLFACITCTTYAFGMGLVGVYDFGTMSPYTAVDNAVMIFAVSFTCGALLRSLIAAVLSDLLRACIVLPPKFESHHYFLMSVLPLSANLMKAPKVLLYYFYTNTVFTLCPHVAAITFTTSKLLHSEFQALKNVYLSGIICFVGFCASLGIASQLHVWWKGIHQGLNITMLLLAFMKVSIIMYIYGVRRFAADVHFWLGFKPALYWIFTWSILPVVLLILLIKYFIIPVAIVEGVEVKDIQKIVMRVWVFTSIVLLIIFLLRIVLKYASQNKLMAIVIASNKYGSPDPDDRKRRKRYSEETTIRQCNHECFLMDDRFDCTHIPSERRRRSSTGDILGDTPEGSVTDVYQGQRTSVMSTLSGGPRTMSTLSETSTIMDVDVH